jgi:hypothetical protein
MASALTPGTYNPISRHVGDMFESYFQPGRLNRPPIMRPVIDLRRPSEFVYDSIDCMDVAEGQKTMLKKSLSILGVPNELMMLDTVTVALHKDEALSAYDWFSLHDRCQTFFNNLRSKLMDIYIAFESESPSHPRLI